MNQLSELQSRVVALTAELDERESRIRALKESEERFRALFTSSNDAIFLTDPTSDAILDVNPKACALLGYAREELVGAAMSMVHPHETPKLAAFSAKVDAEGRGWTDELSCMTKHGAFVAAEVSASVWESEGRNLMIASVRDVSTRRRLEVERLALLAELDAATEHQQILGATEAVKDLLSSIERVAPTQATLLIQGESGTGKELVARAVHARSKRANRPLVRVNCAAIPAELFESEFFGHVKGSFTGASRDRVGRFQLADGGTLFLDEVGEIPLGLQSKLLRVLQEGTFERIGESRARSVDVRVVAATNRNLTREVREGRFREDLYFRLNVFPLKVPPLRERVEDIGLLARKFVAQSAKRLGVPVPTLAPADERNLEQYAWPGNVRELQNVIERGVILARGGRVHIDLSDVGLEQPKAPSPEAPGPAPSVTTLDEVRALERDVIARALDASGGKIYGADGAAAKLGIKATTLASRLKKLGLGKARSSE